ncbi:MAG: hypothetical protein ACYS1C_00070 [Planctomycetota bacterium]|jgi:hypothetical protein
MVAEQRRDPTDQLEGMGSATGRFVKKLFAKKDEAPGEEPAEDRSEQGIAQVPSTVLTVEYVDDSEGMDSALRDLGESLRNMDEQVRAMQETQVRLVGAVNQQAKDIGRIVESLSRRIDRLYRRVTGGEPARARKQEGLLVERMPQAVESEPEPASVGASALPPDVADDPEHQNAWRIARVLAADLEAYHEDAVREGVLYGTFHDVLRQPIEKARKAYEQRLSRDIVESYDYFSRALDELIARKQAELAEEGAP